MVDQRRAAALLHRPMRIDDGIDALRKPGLVLRKINTVSHFWRDLTSSK